MLLICAGQGQGRQWQQIQLHNSICGHTANVQCSQPAEPLLLHAVSVVSQTGTVPQHIQRLTQRAGAGAGRLRGARRGGLLGPLHEAWHLLTSALLLFLHINSLLRLTLLARLELLKHGRKSIISQALRVCAARHNVAMAQHDDACCRGQILNLQERMQSKPGWHVRTGVWEYIPVRQALPGQPLLALTHPPGW
jgi:hypothetical protein